jgi:A/G-specific adenine glycosylase
LLHKRTADDIWKNLYELPLIESSSAVDVEELFSTSSFAQWHEALPQYVYKGCTDGIKHVLSHRVLYSAFYELEVQGPLSCPKGFLAVPLDDLHRYALPRLIERYLRSKNNV